MSIILIKSCSSSYNHQKKSRAWTKLQACL